MKVLAPYMPPLDAPRKLATNRALEELAKAGYEVIRQAFPDRPWLASYWGKGEALIIVEDDKAPTVADIDEIARCPKLSCCYPYAMQPWVETKMSQWRKQGWYTLGVVKFSVEAQAACPSSVWNDGQSWCILDRIIEYPMRRVIGGFHLHERFVPHDHPPIGEAIYD